MQHPDGILSRRDERSQSERRKPMEIASNILPGKQPKLAPSRKTLSKNASSEKKKESSPHEVSRTVSVLPELDIHAQSNASESFVSLAESVDWSKQSARTIRGSLDLALMLNLNKLAVRLAREGSRLFPDDPNLRKAVRVLREPCIRGTVPNSDRKLDDSRKWLCKHAGEYKGKWVAVQAGSLIGYANSLRELQNAISSLFHSKDTLIMKVM